MRQLRWIVMGQPFDVMIRNLDCQLRLKWFVSGWKNIRTPYNTVNLRSGKMNSKFERADEV